MEWKKSPPALIAAFEKAAPKDPRAVRRPMFGYPALFVNGNMFAGTFQDKVVVRLADADRARLLEEKGAAPFEPMPGRAMKEYVVLPRGLVARPASLRSWIERGLAYALTLPPKRK
jgi:TfoX/Sxy family transcriptional regulator of competence genes